MPCVPDVFWNLASAQDSAIEPHTLFAGSSELLYADWAICPRLNNLVDSSSSMILLTTLRPAIVRDLTLDVSQYKDQKFERCSRLNLSCYIDINLRLASSKGK